MTDGASGLNSLPAPRDSGRAAGFRPASAAEAKPEPLSCSEAPANTTTEARKNRLRPNRSVSFPASELMSRAIATTAKIATRGGAG
jgi:hypothetical protein